MADPTLLILFNLLIVAVSFFLGRVYERAKWRECMDMMVRDLKREQEDA